MKVHRSALKHGISSEDALQDAEWSLWIEPLDEDGPPDRDFHFCRMRSLAVTKRVAVCLAALGAAAQPPQHGLPAAS